MSGMQHVECKTCDGDGTVIWESTVMQCGACSGRGWVAEWEDDSDGEEE